MWSLMVELPFTYLMISTLFVSVSGRGAGKPEHTFVWSYYSWREDIYKLVKRKCNDCYYSGDVLHCSYIIRKYT